MASRKKPFLFTLRCVKCHDHKFDPIPTRDYYRIYAAFAGTQMAERGAPFLPEENLEGFEEGRALVERLLEFATAEKQKLDEKREAAARRWFEKHGLEYVSYEERKDLPDEVKPPRHVGLNHVEEGQLKVREQDEWIWTRRLERYEPMAQSVYNGPDPKNLNARKLRMPKNVDLDSCPDSRILMGGSLQAPGNAVQPGVLRRAPAEVEHRRMVAYVTRMRSYHRTVEPHPVRYPTRITRSLVEEFSGRPFEYKEVLPVFENYVPDPKPSDVGSDVRALADMCLMLFNTNEFLYVY